MSTKRPVVVFGASGFSGRSSNPRFASGWSISVWEGDFVAGRGIRAFLSLFLLVFVLRLDSAERYRLDASVDAFNALNRANVDEVSSVYGSPVFCGASPAVPKQYKDATTLAIQRGSVSCGVQAAVANPPAFLSLGLLPVTIPSTPNPVFRRPRAMFNPRQFQFS